ncbi:MAG: NAD-dependent epimerase/dehydratase family protein [Acidobacteriota bacterium]|nr:NAD-dependent epimerase/dehydratase family protein [Acidobacteriota bacterium]
MTSGRAVYGVPTTLPITEDAPANPINPYGITKLFFEKVLQAYSVAHDLRFVALRYFNAAGAHASGQIGEVHQPETHLIPLMMKAALGVTPPLQIFGDTLPTADGTCVRDYVHVSDLGDAHVRALEYLEHCGASISLNLGTGRGISIKELMRALEQLTGSDVPHIYAPPRTGDPPSLFADSTKARNVLSWTPTRALDEILLSAWNWQKKIEASGYEL